MANIRQTNFGGGEISPLLHARTDLPLFARSCRTLRNFFVSKTGSAISRPGTTFVGGAKGVDGPQLGVRDGGQCILIPFNAADDESFCLEFGFNYIRFHTLGGTVLLGGVPYEVATPYLNTELSELKFAQIGEVLTICHPNWDPYELRHVGDDPPVWTFTKAQTQPPTCPVTQSNVAIRAASGWPPFAADPTHVAREWGWRITAILRNDSTGEVVETRRTAVVQKWDGADPATKVAIPALTGSLTVLLAVFSDKPITVELSESPAAFVPAGYTIIGYNWYRGRGELYGFIGHTTETYFVDVGDEPNYAMPPPIANSNFPFGLELAGIVWPGGTESAGGDQRHAARPRCVAYFEQRLVYGGLSVPEREMEVVLSASLDFTDFDKHNLIDVPGEALYVTLAARRRGEMRHLVSLDRLIILGSSGSWHGGGSPNNPIDFDNLSFPHIEEVGASHVPPLVIDGNCLFIRKFGRGARALVPADAAFGYRGFDISQPAEHLFRGLSHDIVSWTYAEDPWGVVWAVRSDGSMLSLTYVRGGEMLAWARHDMDGLVESVCAVREGDEDAVYLVVVRTINGLPKRYIERMTSRHERGGQTVNVDSDTIETPPDYICLECAIPYFGLPVRVFTGLGALEGKQVYIMSQGQPVLGPYTVTGGQIDAGSVLPSNIVDGVNKLIAYVGIKYTCDLEPLDVANGEVRLRQKRVTHVGFEVDNAKGVLVGDSFDNLDAQPTREVADDFGVAPLQSTFILSPISSGSEFGARACLRQNEPLPVTVVGFTRRMVSGDDP